MMTALELRQAMQPWRTAPAWRIAFSGGLDSSVLLHLLTDWARHEDPAASLRHSCPSWPAASGRCLAGALRAVCARLDIPLGGRRRCRLRRGQAGEQALPAVRVMRHSVSGWGRVKHCSGDAQHRDDQAETLLLRLLQGGAGVRGLAAMPASRPLGRAAWCDRYSTVPMRNCRPAQTHGMVWIEGPEQCTDERFSRNFLRAG